MAANVLKLIKVIRKKVSHFNLSTSKGLCSFEYGAGNKAEPNGEFFFFDVSKMCH